jgi:hypothetical protein
MLICVDSQSQTEREGIITRALWEHANSLPSRLELLFVVVACFSVSGSIDLVWKHFSTAEKMLFTYYLRRHWCEGPGCKQSGTSFL